MVNNKTVKPDRPLQKGSKGRQVSGEFRRKKSVRAEKKSHMVIVSEEASGQHEENVYQYIALTISPNLSVWNQGY